jgi:hypothetical protein
MVAATEQPPPEVLAGTEFLYPTRNWSIVDDFLQRSRARAAASG